MDTEVKNVLMTPRLNMFEKLVYVVISTQAGETGQISMSVKNIAFMASCSENSVRRALSKLGNYGLITRRPQTAVDGGQLANLYMVAAAHNDARR